MNAMHMPKFTAESSLYSTRTSYPSIVRSLADGGKEVIPQNRVVDFIVDKVRGAANTVSDWLDSNREAACRVAATAAGAGCGVRGYFACYNAAYSHCMRPI